MQNGDRQLLIFIILLALVLRLFFVLFPSSPVLFSDMRDYHIIASNLLEEGTYGPAVRPPLYPALIALTYRFAGENYIAVRLAQAILGVFTCLLVYIIGLRLSGRKGAILSGLLVACYPSLVIYTNLFMAETLFTFLLVAAIWLLMREGGSRRTQCFAAGIIIGLGCLTKSVLIGFAPLAAIWLWGRRERQSALLCFIGALLVVSPWALRNYHYYQRPVLIDTFSGYNFLVGNNPSATGRQYVPVTDKPKQTPKETTKDDAQVSAESYREGIDFIVNNPVSFLGLGVKKTGYLYGLEIRELSWGYSKNYFGEVPRGILIPVAVAIILSFPLICVLALLGLFFGKSTPGRIRGGWLLLILVVIYFSAAYFITFGESRFHLPFVPILALFAGRLVSSDAVRIQHPRPGAKLRLVIFIILLALLSVNWVLHLRANYQRLKSVLGPGGNTAEVDY